jgi:uncharacterized repeat protein (TIGR03843 family)
VSGPGPEEPEFGGVSPPPAIDPSTPTPTVAQARSRLGPDPEFIEILSTGEVEVDGRMPWSSNATFLTTVRRGPDALNAIYKPLRGERPLWDFPGGLCRREAAAFQLSAGLGWGLVPETVLRHDTPLGVGSLQRFIDADFSEHYFTLMEHPVHHERLREMATFDLLVNNADRKSGHCLLGECRIWGIDNGLSFHDDPKLRTVIWEFAGDAIPAHLLTDIEQVATSAPDGLSGLLENYEIEALMRRAALILERPYFPSPHPDRRPYPWPLV